MIFIDYPTQIKSILSSNLRREKISNEKKLLNEKNYRCLFLLVVCIGRRAVSGARAEPPQAVSGAPDLPPVRPTASCHWYRRGWQSPQLAVAAAAPVHTEQTGAVQALVLVPLGAVAEVVEVVEVEEVEEVLVSRIHSPAVRVSRKLPFRKVPAMFSPNTISEYFWHIYTIYLPGATWINTFLLRTNLYMLFIRQAR